MHRNDQSSDRESPLPLHRRSHGRLVTLFALLVVVAAWNPAIILLNRLRNPERSPMCQMNLHAIGLGLQMYAMAHHDQFPNSLDELSTVDITPFVFICPASSDTPAAGDTIDAQAAAIRAGGYKAGLTDTGPSRHCSYIYFAKGRLWSQLPPKAIIVYEPLCNHEGEGVNVLFGDGHTEWIVREKAEQLIEPLERAAKKTTQPTTAE